MRAWSMPRRSTRGHRPTLLGQRRVVTRGRSRPRSGGAVTLGAVGIQVGSAPILEAARRIVHPRQFGRIDRSASSAWVGKQSQDDSTLVVRCRRWPRGKQNRDFNWPSSRRGRGRWPCDTCGNLPARIIPGIPRAPRPRFFGGEGLVKFDSKQIRVAVVRPPFVR